MSWNDYVTKIAEMTQLVNGTEVKALVEAIADAYENERMVFIAGNGGSGANASHLCEDLGKGTLSDFERQKRLKVISLTNNTPYILAWANDEGYERVFVEQLKNFAQPGALLIAISGSGNSPNILAAIDWANRHGLRTFGMTGFDVLVDVSMNMQASWLSARRHTPVMNRLHGLWSLGTVVGGRTGGRTG